MSSASNVQYMGTYVSGVCTPAAPFFTLPSLHSSFPSLLHPHYELIKRHCDSWILDVAQPPSVPACRLLLECVLPRLICRAIPAASTSVARLIHVTKMISWLTIADDDDDHPDVSGADDATSTQHGGRVMAILHSACKAEVVQQLGPHEYNSTGAGQLMIDSRVPLYASRSKSERKEEALDALAKLWAEMQRDMSPGVRNRFVLTMEHYFQAIKVQATFRKLHRLPDMEAYVGIRRQASFILPCFVLLEYALGIELKDEVYTNPLVEKFRTCALDYICLCNDLISCKSEMGVGDYFNMPAIAYNSNANKEWSFQDAIDHVASMIKDLDGQCVLMLPLFQQSSFLPSLQHSPVNTYVTALCSCMSGSLAWYLETPRYGSSSSRSSSSLFTPGSTL